MVEIVCSPVRAFIANDFLSSLLIDLAEHGVRIVAALITIYPFYKFVCRSEFKGNRGGLAVYFGWCLIK